MHVQEIVAELEAKLGLAKMKTTDLDPHLKNANGVRERDGKLPLFRTYRDGEEVGFVTLLTPDEFTPNDESYIAAYRTRLEALKSRGKQAGGPPAARKSGIKSGEAFEQCIRDSLQVSVILPASGGRGLKYASIENRTIHAFACTPPLLHVLEHGFKKDFFSTRRPGVYVVFGLDPSGRVGFYVGQSNDVIFRLSGHRDRRKGQSEKVRFKEVHDFLFFIASDNRINVDYLEASLIRLANNSHGVMINSSWPNPTMPSESSRRAADEQLRVVCLLASVLGYNMFLRKAGPLDRHFVLRAQNDLVAHGTFRGKGFLVFSGSHARATTTSSLESCYRDQREEMIAKGILVQDGEHLRFTEDYLFSGVHSSASIITGTQRNGKQAWVDEESGKSLSQVERETPNESEDEPVRVEVDGGTQAVSNDASPEDDKSSNMEPGAPNAN